jgi:TPR repeat protein
VTRQTTEEDPQARRVMTENGCYVIYALARRTARGGSHHVLRRADDPRGDEAEPPVRVSRGATGGDVRDLIKAGCVALVVSLSLAAPVAAGPFEDGVAAYKRGDYASALRLWPPLAEQGDPDAQNLLGLMYDNGHVVLQDYVQAHKWSNLAAAHFPASETESRE